MNGSNNPAAFNAYLEGERLFSVTSEAQMAEARKRFEMALSLDPDFARAWGYLSYATVRSVLVGWLDRAELLHAEHCAKMAVRLGPDDYSNHWDLAFVYQNTQRLDQAVEQYETARRLYDHFTDKLDRKPGLLAEMAVAYVQSGEHGKAIALGEKAQLIPHWYRWNTGFAYYMSKNYDRAIEQFELMDFGQNRSANPYYVPEMELFIAAAYAMRANGQKGKGAASDKGKARAAMERFKRAMKINPFGKARLTRSDVELRRSFKKNSDQAHWLAGLREAGLWDKDNPEK